MSTRKNNNDGGYNSKKINKNSKLYTKSKRRKKVLFIIFLGLLILVVESVFNDWKQIYSNINEKKELETQYASLKEEEERLNGEVVKLQDPDYLLRYAREKYGYSKDGELIIRMD